MNKKRLFKEIEVEVVNATGRPALLFDDIDKVLYDLCFSKSKLDIHTLRVIKTLFSSIRLTYKALEENEQLDANEMSATVYLSRKKVKKVVRKALKISKRDRSIDESDMDELNGYLAAEEPTLAVSKEEALETIHEGVNSSLKPYTALLDEIMDKIKEDTAENKSLKKKSTKKKTVAEEQPAELEVEDELDDVDFEELENGPQNKKKKRS